MHREDAQAAALQEREIPGPKVQEQKDPEQVIQDQEVQDQVVPDQAAKDQAGRIREEEAAVQGEEEGI